MVCRQKQLKYIQFEIFTWSKTVRKKERIIYLFILYFSLLCTGTQLWTDDDGLRRHQMSKANSNTNSHLHTLAFASIPYRYGNDWNEEANVKWRKAHESVLFFSVIILCFFVARFCFASSSYIIEMNVWCHFQLYIFAFKTAPLQTNTYIPRVLFNYSLAVKRF